MPRSSEWIIRTIMVIRRRHSTSEEKEMTNEQLVALLQDDLKNERMHCLFYQQAASLVEGLHREEYRELFLKEAQSELVHVDEFSNLIKRLGGTPGTEVAPIPTTAA